MNALMSHYAVKPLLPEALLSPETNFYGTHRNLNISDNAVIMPPLASSFKKHLARGRLGRQVVRDSQFYCLSIFF